MTARLIIGDTRDITATIPDGSVDLIVTSPPFLALRSYLPADHPDKHREMGSEATPAEFIDTLLELTAEWRRVLAPHGSICVELGDTYSGSGGAGGDYNDGGLRDGQQKFSGSAKKRAANGLGDDYRPARAGRDAGWPLAKSLCGIPTLYPWSLAYGRNLLTGQASPAGQWRIRNLIVWARPNPPVGALGDKFRPATSYITVACTSAKRWFDLDAVRDGNYTPRSEKQMTKVDTRDAARAAVGLSSGKLPSDDSPAGAPPLDWHSDMPDEDGDWLWRLATARYTGAHDATYPYELPRRFIDAMCPRRVCTTCGKPSERISGPPQYVNGKGKAHTPHVWASGMADGAGAHTRKEDGGITAIPTTLGWTDCGCGDGCQATTWVTTIAPVLDDEGNPMLTKKGKPKMKRQRVVDHPGECRDETHWRRGVVFDPFAGSGTTLEAATALGRHSIGIDLDPRNAHLARQRCGMFLDVESEDNGRPVVDVPLPEWEEDAS